MSGGENELLAMLEGLTTHSVGTRGRSATYLAEVRRIVEEFLGQ